MRTNEDLAYESQIFKKMIVYKVIYFYIVIYIYIFWFGLVLFGFKAYQPL